MVYSYHELTYNEPRGGGGGGEHPQRKLQFHIICVVIVVTTVYSFVSNGILHPVELSYGTFRGGTYIYKLTQRDYSSAQSLLEYIVYTDLVCNHPNDENETKHEKVQDDNNNNDKQTTSSSSTSSRSTCYHPVHDDIVHQLYTIYMDNPSIVTNGRDRRYTVGYLIRSSSSSSSLVSSDDTTSSNVSSNSSSSTTATTTKVTKASEIVTTTKKDSIAIRTKLVQINASIVVPTKEEIENLPATVLWSKLPYHQIELPDTDVRIVQYPYYYDSFVSLIIQSIKVFPALYNIITPQNDIPILSSCSVHQSMCTYYIPIASSSSTTSLLSSPFFLGQPDTTTYVNSLPVPSNWFDHILNFLFPTTTTESTTIAIEKDERLSTTTKTTTKASTLAMTIQTEL